jgi:hypothetical protein
MTMIEPPNSGRFLLYTMMGASQTAVHAKGIGFSDMASLGRDFDRNTGDRMTIQKGNLRHAQMSVNRRLVHTLQLSSMI